MAVGSSVRSSVPGGGYSSYNGTSMATPHVAGAVLLLRDAFPQATPDQIKIALYLTAVDMGSSGEDNSYGRGRIDVVEASMTARYSVDCLGPDTGSMAIDYADLGQPVASEFLLVSLSYGRAAVVSNPLGGLMEVWLQTAVKHAAIVQN